MKHEETGRALLEIIECVKRQGKALEIYLKQMDESKDNSMYSAVYLQKNVDEKLQRLVEIAHENGKAFDENIEAIKECENAMKENIDITAPDFQGAVNLIAVLGEGIPNVVARDIVKTLRGQHRALQTVKELMEKKGIAIPDDLNKYFGVDGAVDHLAGKLAELSMDPNNISRYIGVAKDIEKTASVCGLDIDAVAELKSGMDYEYLHDASLRSSMGL